MTPLQRQRKREAYKRWYISHREQKLAEVRDYNQRPERRRFRNRYSREWNLRKRLGLPTVGLAEQLRAERAATPICECGRLPGSCVPCGGTEEVA